LTKILYIQF